MRHIRLPHASPGASDISHLACRENRAIIRPMMFCPARSIMLPQIIISDVISHMPARHDAIHITIYIYYFYGASAMRLQANAYAFAACLSACGRYGRRLRYCPGGQYAQQKPRSGACRRFAAVFQTMQRTNPPAAARIICKIKKKCGSCEPLYTIDQAGNKRIYRRPCRPKAKDR